MDYIIMAGHNTYVQFGTDGRRCLTTNIKNAAKFPFEKAYSIIHNQVSPDERDKYSIVAVSAPEKAEIKQQIETYSPTMFDNGDCDWGKMCDNFADFLVALPQYKINLGLKLRDIEAKKIDVEHYIELQATNENQEKYAVRLLCEVLQERRAVKDEERIVNTLLEYDLAQYANGDIHKELEKMAGRSYKPRMLPELFDEGGCNDMINMEEEE